MKNRVRKIVNFSISANKTKIKTFLDTINIIYRWVLNFSEIERSLIKFIEKTNWRWTVSEQLSFDIFRIKSFIFSMMHDYDYLFLIHFYSNVSLYDNDLIITQFSIHDNKITKISILYDSIFFSSIEKKYFTYKQKLCIFIKFVIKYDYFCKHSRNQAIIHTDHKLLIRFLKTNCHENIYKH